MPILERSLVGIFNSHESLELERGALVHCRILIGTNGKGTVLPIELAHEVGHMGG